MIVSGTTRGRAAYDDINYHAKVIRQFAQELPNPVLDNYLSATTPGYHLVLAVAARMGLDSRLALQLLACTFSVALVVVLARAVAARFARDRTETAAWLTALACVLPLTWSPYFIQSAVWLVPDNAAWLGVVGILLIALMPRQTYTSLAAMGAVLLWLVWARQVHAWAAGLIWAAAWLRGSLPAAPDDGGSLLSWRDLVPTRPRGWAEWMVFAAVVSLPGVLSVWWFWNLWGRQLIPPAFIEWYQPGVRLGTAAFTLSLLAIYGVFFGSHWWAGVRTLWRTDRLPLFAAGALGLGCALLGPTDASPDEGRMGAVWSLFARLPTVGRTSLAVAALSVLGAVVVVSFLRQMDRRERWIMLAALAGFAASQTLNTQTWQRYHEPMVLAWLALAAGLAASRRQRPIAPAFCRVARIALPVLLGVGLLALALQSWAASEPAPDRGYTLDRIETPPWKARRQAPTP